MSHETDVQAQFSTRVPIYDRRSAWILDTEIIGAMVAAAAIRGDETLLDVCCGTGAVGGAFAGAVRRRVGVDLTPAMLDAARPRLDEVVLGDARALPFPDASFDLVVSRQAVHFLPDPGVGIVQMGRVLRPGGRLVLGQRVPYGEADEAWMRELNALKQPNLQTFILESHLRDGMARAGVTDIVARNVHVWEDINDWVTSPEVPEANRARILEHCRTAPDAVRAVHPIEVDGDAVRCCWRWVILTGTKAAG